MASFLRAISGLYTAGLQQAHITRTHLKASCTTFSLHSDGGASEGLLCWSLSLRCYTSVLSSIPWHAVQEAAEVAPTEEEVATAKSETLNSFVFNFAFHKRTDAARGCLRPPGHP